MSQGHANDFAFEVARGSRKGMERIVMCGINADVDAAEDIWEGGGDVPAFDGTGYLLEVLSSDADDDGSPVDTGALTIRVEGVDENGDYQEADVVMNGTNAVAIPTLLWGFVNRAYVLTAGTSLVNEGTITVRIASGGATKALITALHGISDGAFYYVPNGYRFILENVNFWSTTSGTTTIGVGRIRAGVFQFQAHVAMTNAAIQPAMEPMIPYLAGDLVKVRVSAVSAVNQSVGAILRGVLLSDAAV